MFLMILKINQWKKRKARRTMIMMLIIVMMMITMIMRILIMKMKMTMTISHLSKGNQHLPEEVVLGEAIPVIDLRETTNLPFQIVT